MGTHGAALPEQQAGLREALKLVAVTLKELDAPFALTGGYALWARGGPEPEHDVDFMVAEEDAARVADHLAERGLQVVQPPEDWLFKVYTDDAMVDVLFRAAGSPVQTSVLRDATEVEVLSVRMPVLAATDLIIQKLTVLSERYCDLAQVLPACRALREQVDWPRVRSQVVDNPFAEAVMLLLDRLEVVPAP
jgi:hypothetical protein